jgi:thiol-disulfide isomerase/thioredoxin
MKKRKSLIKAVILAALVLPAGAFARGAGDAKETAPAEAPEPQEKIKVYFFYEELCELCHTDVDRFSSILQENLPLAEREQYPNSINILNVHETLGRSVYVQLTDDMGLDRGTLETPLLIVGGRVFQGYDSISANIREAYLTAAEDLYVNKRPYNPRTRKNGENLFDDYSVNPGNVTIVYFYRITCPECAKVTPLIDALPGTVTVNGKQKPLDIIRINTRSGNNGERIAAFFEAWQVPDKDRMVPIVFFSGSYLAGYEAITAALNRRLTEEGGPWKLIPVKTGDE